MATIQLGPCRDRSRKLIKEIMTRKYHLDLVFKCDNGTYNAHRFMVGAQSKYLKSLLLEQEDRDVAEVLLPEVKIEHLKRALKFMYTGKLKVTKDELINQYLVWHVQKILKEVLRIDANLNIAGDLLKPPPEENQNDEPPDPPAPDRNPGVGGSESSNRVGGWGGGGDGSMRDRLAREESTYAVDQGFRQNSGFRQSSAVELDLAHSSVGYQENAENSNGDQDIADNFAGDQWTVDNSIGDQEIAENTAVDEQIAENSVGDRELEHNSETSLHKNVDQTSDILNENEDSDIEVIQVPRINTPDIIDLLESSDDEGPVPAPPVVSSYSSGRISMDEDNSAPEMNVSASVIVNENAEDGTEVIKNLTIPEAPKLLSKLNVPDPMNSESEEELYVKKKAKKKKILKKAGKTTKESKVQSKGVNEVVPEPLNSDSDDEFIVKKTTKKTKIFKKSRKTKKDPISPLKGVKADVLNAMVKKEAPVAEVKPIRNTNGSASSTLIPAFKLDPDKTVYRGKIINLDEKPKPTAHVKGVRKHTHNAYTLTGLKKAETLVVVKEEKAVHTCDECGALFEKYRSLEVHRQRIHEDKKFPCPECNKRLKNAASIKKHLLTHRPESEWPHKCPLCDKRFQARADIPKHLMTKAHEEERDNLPKVGTLEWFNLIYPEMYGHTEDLVIKTEKSKEKERKKLKKLSKEFDVTVEEYDNWDPATMAKDNSVTSHVQGGGSSHKKTKGKRKRSSVSSCTDQRSRSPATGDLLMKRSRRLDSTPAPRYTPEVSDDEQGL